MTPHIRQSDRTSGLAGLLSSAKGLAGNGAANGIAGGPSLPEIGGRSFQPLSKLDFNGAKPFADVLGAYSQGAYAPLKALAVQDFSPNGPVPVPTRPLTQSDLAGLQHPAAPNEHDKLEKMAEKWVGTTFFGTLLKQMRESPWRNETLDGGKAGQAYGSLYDQHMADRLAKGAGKKLVRSIVRKFESQKAYAKQAKKASSLNDATLQPSDAASSLPTSH